MTAGTGVYLENKRMLVLRRKDSSSSPASGNSHSYEIMIYCNARLINVYGTAGRRVISWIIECKTHHGYREVRRTGHKLCLARLTLTE